MKINPKTWNQKQKLIGGTAIAVLLIGGSSIGIVSANHHAKEVKAEQVKQDKATAKAEKLKKEKLAQSQAKTALDVAETADNQKKIATAESLITKVTDKKVQEAFTSQLNGIKSRVKVENSAKSAVSNYSKDAMNQGKYKTAQQALAKLTSNYSKTLKDQLTKQLSDSKTQANKATKAEEAKKQTEKQKAQSSSNTASSNQNTSGGITVNSASASNTQENVSQSSPSNGQSNNQTNQGSANSNNNTGGQGQSNVTPSPSPAPTPSPTPDPTPNPAPKPQPTYKYLGWVSVDGVRQYTKLCDTVAEAQSFATSTANSPEVNELGFEGHSINYGLDTIEV
ncbi:hypothetical protein [Lactococcus lactis]|uniref:hypothetical protein n=1 Tax=Lactococcus lactis TaxID=1358 RepID=UPI001F5B7FCE|nr:hypothetical protein [Lactococcus lactis]WDA68864.1 hypothetical protein IL310_02105 [Lactococcus lactis]